MTPFQMAMTALRERPPNYASLPASRQWEVDKALGILDWDGVDMVKARACVEAGDISLSANQFKMNLDELRQVVRLFDLNFPPKEETNGDS